MIHSTFYKMNKYKSIIIAFLFVTIHIVIILVLFKKPSIDQDKINKQNIKYQQETTQVQTEQISDMRRRSVSQPLARVKSLTEC